MIRIALTLVMAIFFLCGFTTVFNSVLNPYFQNTRDLNYSSIVLIQVAFYSAYFIFSPIAGNVFRDKYILGIRLGLFIGVLGMLSMALAATLGNFSLILGAIFMQGSAIAILQVTANPYVFLLGDSSTAPSRFLFAQAFTSMGMVAAPYLGAVWILSRVEATESALPIPYFFQAIIWLTLFVLATVASLPRKQSQLGDSIRRHPLKDKQVIMGMVAIGMCVGVETTIASFIIQYLADPRITGLSLTLAGKLTVLFWIGFMLGRFIGSWLLRFISQERLLLYHGMMGVFLAGLTVTSTGLLAAFAVLALGISTSNLFPLVFSMVLSKAKCCKTQASGYLCMANIGGALLPLLQGRVADTFNLQLSFCVPVACYVFFIVYGVYQSRLDVNILKPVE